MDVFDMSHTHQTSGFSVSETSCMFINKKNQRMGNLASYSTVDFH